VHHHVGLTKTFWFSDNGLLLHLVHDNIRALHKLPAEMQVPYGNWIAYLTDMVKYLNAVVFLKEDAYPLLRSSLIEDPIHLTAYDAAVFVEQHFPLETLRLNTEEAKLALLIRAAHFAYSDKYSGDVYEQYSENWAVLLYVIKKGHFPVNIGSDHGKKVGTFNNNSYTESASISLYTHHSMISIYLSYPSTVAPSINPLIKHLTAS